MNNFTIPPITDKLGYYWTQPSSDNILIDETHAIMTRKDFDKLSDYSFSTPTGTYVGKMWKCKTNDNWYLAWYDTSECPDKLRICFRKILIVD